MQALEQAERAGFLARRRIAFLWPVLFWFCWAPPSPAANKADGGKGEKNKVIELNEGFSLPCSSRGWSTPVVEQTEQPQPRGHGCSEALNQERGERRGRRRESRLSYSFTKPTRPAPNQQHS